MASRAYTEQGAASAVPHLSTILSAIPSLPRPVLARLTARLIERMDEMDGDSDLEDDDPDTSAEDDPLGFDPEEDIGAEEKGEDAGEGDVCDDRRPIADPLAYRQHVRRLKRERCFPLRRVRLGLEGYETHQLCREPEAPTRRQILRRKRGVPRQPRA